MDDADRPTMDECLAGAKAALIEGYVIMMTAPLDEAARLAMRPGSDSFEVVRARIAERRRVRGVDIDGSPQRQQNGNVSLQNHLIRADRSDQ